MMFDPIAGNTFQAFVFTGFLALFPAAANAQSSPRLFSVPAGCEAYLTVQSNDCTLNHYWRCTADPEGTFWSVAIDADGPFYLSFSDAEYRWLATYELRSGIEARLVTPEEDPASLTELFATGTDSMVFEMERNLDGTTVRRSYTGFDRLTGAEVEIDGEPLLLTEFRYQFETDAGLQTVTGNQFVSRARRLFFGGLETVTLPSGESFEGDYSPREFIEPGEPGFLTMEPLHGCGEVMSGLGPLLPEARG